MLSWHGDTYSLDPKCDSGIASDDPDEKVPVDAISTSAQVPGLAAIKAGTS